MAYSNKLSCKFLGMDFENPFMLASAPPTRTGEMIARAFQAGWGGAVIKTANLDPKPDKQPRFAPVKHHGEMIGMQNIEMCSTRPPEIWQQECAELKRNWPNKILWASIIAGMDRKAWQRLAEMMQEAGFDALELNISCPHGVPDYGMGSFIGQSPELSAQVTAWVKQVAKIPVIVKLTPNVTDIAAVAHAVKEAGADGLAAINTLAGLSGVDTTTMRPRPTVDGDSTFGGHSGPCVKPVALRAIAAISQKTGLPVSGIGGIANGHDAAEFSLLGAGTFQVCTAVMWHGYKIIDNLRKELCEVLDVHNLNNCSELRGQALNHIKLYEELSQSARFIPQINPDCHGCKRCVTACQDGAFQAIKIKDGKAEVDLQKCGGCGLCAIVCPSGMIHG